METTREKVKQAVIDYILEYGYSPTMQDIADRVLRVPSVVCVHISELIKAGDLETSHPGMARALRVPELQGNRLSYEKMKEAIKQISGCDGADDYANGWDDACEPILWEIEEMREKECTGKWM